jgi:hypothetical protein
MAAPHLICLSKNEEVVAYTVNNLQLMKGKR